MTVNTSGFLLCPLCGRRTHIKVLPETELKHFPLWCNRCKIATNIDYNRK